MKPASSRQIASLRTRRDVRDETNETRRTFLPQNRILRLLRRRLSKKRKRSSDWKGSGSWLGGLGARSTERGLLCTARSGWDRNSSRRRLGAWQTRKESLSRTGPDF